MILYKKILECKLDFPYEITTHCKDMIRRLLCIHPEKRIKINEIKEHPFYLTGLKHLKNREFILDHKALSNKTIEKLVKLGFKLSDIKYTIKNNEINNISTAYNLLYNKSKSLAFKRNIQGKEKDSKSK